MKLRKAFAIAATPLALLAVAGCQQHIDPVTVAIGETHNVSRNVALDEQGQDFKTSSCTYTDVRYDGGYNQLDGEISGFVTVVTKGSGSAEQDQKGVQLLNDLKRAQQKGTSVDIEFNGKVMGPKGDKLVELDCGAKVVNPVTNVKFVVG